MREICKEGGHGAGVSSHIIPVLRNSGQCHKDELGGWVKAGKQYEVVTIGIKNKLMEIQGRIKKGKTRVRDLLL